MNYLKKISRSILIGIGIFLILAIFFTLLSYLNILNGNFNIIIKMLIPLLSFFIGGVSIGIKTLKKGWMEGLKLGLILLVIIILLNIIFFRHFALKNIIYYLLLILSSTLGSMVGMLKKKA